MLPPSGLLHVGGFCAINRPSLYAWWQYSSPACLASLLSSSVSYHGAQAKCWPWSCSPWPRRSYSCSSHGGHRGAAPAPASSSSEEGFWRYDFLLRVRGQSATRILLPPAFSSIVYERGLDGLLLRLQGCFRSSSYVEL